MRRLTATLALVSVIALAGEPTFGQAARTTGPGVADVERLQVALAQEQKAEFLYLLMVGSGRVQSSYPTMLAIHDAHLKAVTGLTETITRLGAAPVRPRTNNDYVEEAHTMSATSEADVVDLARSLERDGADLYARLGRQLQDPVLVRRAADLRSDDEAHGQALARAFSG
jgi:hypothetical protein